MALAIAEGRKGSGFVSPNPLVGCVILDRDSRLIGKGYHARVGEAHAEVNALRAISDPGLLVGAHVYVTLEPCAHEGRTPSCAKTLAALPIASVTYGLEDPFPQVSGKGAEILRQAGIEVRPFQDLQEELEELAEIFLLNQRLRRPFVALKVASSFDGKIALADGRSQWITGEAARAQVQVLRGSYDAVLTGRGTFTRDNPRLDARNGRYKEKSQRVVLLDPEGKSLSELPSSRLWGVRSPEDIFLVTRSGVSCNLPLQHLEVPGLESGKDFDLAAVLSQLKSKGLHSILVESGERTVSSFLRAGLVDRIYLFLAPKILGSGLSWTSGVEIPSLDRAIVLHSLRIQTFGEDILLSARVGSAIAAVPR
ncbi:MAG: bifunctional diaminohydroxyphosphoribosylaminopyrimidine deaminase/5-amino-6-(5-phosphoribosylamino)uracil reductase RibD [Bdellovibrionales bacterium]